MLARGGSITDEEGVISILQKVDLASDRVAAVTRWAQCWVIQSITVLKMMADNGSPW